VLDLQPRAGGLGLRLFLDQGMYSWMQICANHAQAPTPEPSLPRTTQQAAAHEIESEIVRILASMAIHSSAAIQEPV
jgi:hypothetical protein